MNRWGFKPHPLGIRELNVSKIEDFQLEEGSQSPSDFELEPYNYETGTPHPTQAELFLPDTDPEHPENTPQIEFDGMAPPVFTVALHDGREVRFQHARTLLESLEAQQVDIHYQCREGYCGSCRVQLLEGAVHYLQEPMAWLDDDEILPCCCIPRTDLKIKL